MKTINLMALEKDKINLRVPFWDLMSWGAKNF